MLSCSDASNHWCRSVQNQGQIAPKIAKRLDKPAVLASLWQIPQLPQSSGRQTVGFGPFSTSQWSAWYVRAKILRRSRGLKHIGRCSNCGTLLFMTLTKHCYVTGN